MMPSQSPWLYTMYCAMLALPAAAPYFSFPPLSISWPFAFFLIIVVVTLNFFVNGLQITCMQLQWRAKRPIFKTLRNVNKKDPTEMVGGIDGSGGGAAAGNQSSCLQFVCLHKLLIHLHTGREGSNVECDRWFTWRMCKQTADSFSWNSFFFFFTFYSCAAAASAVLVLSKVDVNDVAMISWCL